MVVWGPFALLVVENRQRAPELAFFEHRRADRRLQPAVSKIGWRGQLRLRRKVAHRGCLPAEHRCAHDALPVLECEALEARREANRHDRRLEPLLSRGRQKACAAVDPADGGLETSLLGYARALRHLAQSPGYLSHSS